MVDIENSSVSQKLLALSQVDAGILGHTQRRTQLQERREMLSGELEEQRKGLATLEEEKKLAQARQAEEEQRLRDENEKIVQRRKQLTALGGAKAARLVEREIDIASRTLQAMEQRQLKILEELEDFDRNIKERGEIIEKLHHELHEGHSAYETQLVEIEKELASLQEERQVLVTGLEERLLQLYNRVKSRYPTEPVAVAANGSCRSCFRALPPQTYNQILAGNFSIQCPGCSRILVYLPEEAETA